MEKVLDKELKGIISFDSHDYGDHLWRYRWKQIVTIRWAVVWIIDTIQVWYMGGKNIYFMIEIESDSKNTSDY